MKIKTPFFVIEIEWLLLVVILIYILFPQIKILLDSFFICYLFIIFHELSHMFIAAMFGKTIDVFKFSISGVNIHFKKEKYVIEKNTNKIAKIQDMLIYFAGPFSNLLLATIFYRNPLIVQVNIFLALLNLLPIYPLDGFNIYNAILDMAKLESKKETILTITSYIFMVVLLIVSIYEIIINKNPSTLIFIIYLYIIRNDRKRTLKIDKILQQVSC